MREQKAENFRLIKEYENTHLENMTIRDPYRTKITQDSLKGTYLNSSSRSKKLKYTNGFNDTELAGPQYDAI